MKYNKIVTVSYKDDTPITSFTMLTDDENEIIKAVLDYLFEKEDKPDLENIKFKYETVEVNEEVWQGE